MSRPSRSERLAAKGRPKRRAAKTHFFKYQLANNPTRAEENDLKRALEESLKEQTSGASDRKEVTRSRNSSHNNNNNNQNNNNNNNVSVMSYISTNSSDVTNSNKSYSSNSSNDIGIISNTSAKRTRSSTSLNYTTNNTPPTNNKRAKSSTTPSPITATNGHLKQSKCDETLDISFVSTPTTLTATKNMRTYSRQTEATNVTETSSKTKGPNSSTPITVNRVNQGHKISPTSGANQQSRSSKSTQTVNSSKASNLLNGSTKIPQHRPTLIHNNKNDHEQAVKSITPEPYLKSKRESKNYAYVKMTALKVSTSKSPSNNSRSSNSAKKSPTNISNNNFIDKDSKINSKTNRSTPEIVIGTTSTSFNHNNSETSTKSNSKVDSKTTKKIANSAKKSSLTSSSLNESSTNLKASDNTKVSKNFKAVQNSTYQRSNNLKPDKDGRLNTKESIHDCSIDDDTSNLSDQKQDQAQVKIVKKRCTQGSWSLLGVPEEKLICLRDDLPPRRLICYPAIKHVEGDVIQVRDSVLLRSGAKKTDLPYIAKVCAFWEDAETGNVMMSLFWYYRPEHTEEGRKPYHLVDEIFASRHRDMDSVECIEDKCYVLTFNEYCRYRKRCKMEQVNTTWSLSDVTIPVSNEPYPRRNRMPDSDVNPELVFCCRQIYDSRMRRLIKNPLTSQKYGHT